MYYFVRKDAGKFNIGYQGIYEEAHFYSSYVVDIDCKNTKKVIMGLKKENPTIDTVIPLVISGKTYADRKESLRQLAILIQHSDQGGMYMSEACILEEFFETNARRYGLTEEFEENGII